MGSGYWVLVWDGFSWGLNLTNPRLHMESIYNWFSCPEGFTEDDADKKHGLTEKYGSFFRVVFAS